jgi:SAM-dependent methyltransferase
MGASLSDQFTAVNGQMARYLLPEIVVNRSLNYRVQCWHGSRLQPQSGGACRSICAGDFRFVDAVSLEVSAMVRLSDVLDHGPAYAIWQRPFINSKLRPVLQDRDFADCRRVLDLGCGPGINTPFFDHADYTGLDWNDAYIEYARKRYGKTYISADACTWQPDAGKEFDLVFANSFFHHIDDENVDRILERMSRSLSVDGVVHILDLVLPEKHRVGRWLAKNDRGDFPRSLDHWHELFSRQFEPLHFEPYSIDFMGLGLWQMVHFKGKPRTGRTET